MNKFIFRGLAKDNKFHILLKQKKMETVIGGIVEFEYRRYVIRADTMKPKDGVTLYTNLLSPELLSTDLELAKSSNSEFYRICEFNTIEDAIEHVNKLTSKKETT